MIKIDMIIIKQIIKSLLFILAIETLFYNVSLGYGNIIEVKAANQATNAVQGAGGANKSADDNTVMDGLDYKYVYATKIYIGPEVKEIKDASFVNSHYLREIVVAEGNPNYSSYCGCLYNKDQTKLLCFPMRIVGTKLPTTVVEADKYALKNKSQSIKSQVEAVMKRNRGE